MKCFSFGIRVSSATGPSTITQNAIVVHKELILSDAYYPRARKIPRRTTRITGLRANLLAKRQVCTNIDAGMFRVQGDLLDQTTFQER